MVNWQERMDRFHRLTAAFDAAARWELYRSQNLFGNKLLELGAYIDDAGDWRIDRVPPQVVRQ